jgi:outer membrane receptor protein involved in Fe transport
MNYRRNDVSDFTTGVLTVPLQEVFSMTSFATGISDFAEQRFPQRKANPIALWSAGFYGEDDWRVSDRLKLTLGLRLDHDSNPVCQTNCFNRFAAGPFENVTTNATTPYNQIIAAGLHQAFPQTDTIVWQPRIGFAWQPFGNGHGTVIRGGAGLFSDLLAATLVDNYITNAPGDVTIVDQSGTTAFAPAVPGSTFSLMQNSGAGFFQQFNSGGNAAAVANVVPGFAGISYQATVNHLHTPRFQEWNLELEQAIGSKTSVSANYVGNHGLHIPIYYPWENVACRSASSCGNLAPKITTTRQNTEFSTVRELTTEGYSHYNGVVLALQRKFSAGLQGSVSYTWSHALDSVSNGGILPWSLNDSVLTQISPFNQEINYGNSDYDVRHSVNANYVYEVPFKFSNGFLNQVLGGWTLSGTFFYHTGYPFSVTDSTGERALLRNGTNTTYLANITGPVDYFSCTRGPAVTVPAGGSDNCLDFSSFSPVGTPGTVNAVTGTPNIAIPGTFTTQRRNQFRGPMYFNTDMSLRKAFKLTERFRLSVGANAYNVLNHPNFGNPGGALTGGNLGSYFTTVNPPTSALGSGLGGDAASRSVQLEGRLTF